MMPKISVSPAASMNNSRPYCRLLSNWIRKLAKSMVQEAGEWKTAASKKQTSAAGAPVCSAIG
jgi:hypothetical protein